MQNAFNYFDIVPEFVPKIMTGTLLHKIRVKTDYKRADNTCSLYLELYQKNKGRKRLGLNLYINPKHFDVKKQRVKSTFKNAKDYNLLIEKMLSDINKIKITYRLNEEDITIDKLIEDLTKPSLRVNFCDFYEHHLKQQYNDKIIAESTYKQQSATLKKIKSFSNPLFFSDINEDLLNKFKNHCKTELDNKPATVQIAVKNFKKYLHLANAKGIKTELQFSDISIKKVSGSFTFLTPEEINKFYRFYNSEFITETWRNILQRYLFSCFTGLRISDIEQLTPDNFIDNTLVFTSHKSKKLQRLRLNNTAYDLVSFPEIFKGDYKQQTINKELKLIAKSCGIKKRVYFHSARHTFATNYLITGGKIRNLQKALGHSDIKTTLIYSHVVESILDDEITQLDSLITS